MLRREWDASSLLQRPGWILRAAELALGALGAEHMELVVDARVGAPLVGRVLVAETAGPQSAQIR